MKSHKKLVALIVALTFVLSLAVPMSAGAATAEDNSASKLNSLGIIEGYPDGTFGLDKDITRAEFAKIAVIASGNKAAADLLKNTPSVFSDVKTGEWYTGWINLAASLGYVKGDQGKFRPGDKITYAEVLTILVRLLGYNDNLPGDWPTDYLVKAVSLGITEGVTFDAKAPAVRGSVFRLADATLDTKTVTYNKETNEFTEGANTLVQKSIETGYNKGVLEFVTQKDNGDIVATIDGIEYKVLSNATFVGAQDAFEAENYYVKFVAKDKTTIDEITYLEVDKEVRTVVTGRVAEKDLDGDRIKIGTKWYKYDDGFKVYLDFVKETKDYGATGARTEAEIFGDVAVGDVATLIYKDSDLLVAKFDTYAPKVVGEVRVRADEVKIVSKGAEGTDTVTTKDKNVLVIKDNKQATFADLSEDDVYQVFSSKRGADSLIVATSKKVTGTADRLSAALDTITVGGTEYTLGANSMWHDSSDKTIADADKKGLVGKEVVLAIGFDGRVKRVEGTPSTDTSEFPALVRGVTQVTTVSGEQLWVSILKGDGTKTDYQLTKDTKFGLVIDYVANTPPTAATISEWDSSVTDAKTKITGALGLGAGDLVFIKLATDGTVSQIINKKAESATIQPGSTSVFDKDGKRIKVGEVWYGVNDSTVLFDGDSSTKAVITWDKIVNSGDLTAQLVVKDGMIKQLNLTDSTYLATANKLGMVLDEYITADGTVLDIDIKGTTNTYVEANDTVINSVYSAKKKLVAFTLNSSGKISAIDALESDSAYSKAKTDNYIESIDLSSMLIKVDANANLNGTEATYFIDSAVSVYDITGTNVKIAELADLAKFDKVDLYVKDSSGKVVYIVVKP